MKIIARIFCSVLLLIGTSFIQASQQHQHEEHHDAAPQGPHGGHWLAQDDIAVELTVFAAGIKPEMRVYIYRDGTQVTPGNVDIEVRLNRLGGDSELLNFSAEKDYWVSNKPLREPHSFDVDVSATINNQHYQWAFESHQGRSEISERLVALAEIKSERVQAQTLIVNDTLFGVIEAPTDNVFRVNAAYQGLVERVFVKVGQPVKKDQPLVQLKNTETLQSYTLKSPAGGEVTAVNVNAGDRAEAGALLEVTDLSTVWVSLSAFPQSIENLAVGQAVKVYDLHQHQRVATTLDYIAPMMTGGHIARARAVLDNSDGHWRAGMHIKADIEIDRRSVPLAVRATALQIIEDKPVVFAKYGNVFEARSVVLGATDGRFVEVLEGLAAGTEYVTENSFLLKAEILKGGVSHSH